YLSDRFDRGFPPDDGDLVLAHQKARALVQSFRDRAGSLDYGGGIIADLLCRQSVLVGVFEVIEYLGRTQQCFRRNAPPIQTNAAEIFTLDDCCLETELSRPDGGNIAPRTRADDDHVKARFSHSSRSRSRYSVDARV